MDKKQYYHLSAGKLAVGLVLRGQGKRPLQEQCSEVEEVLESNRPSDQPDRGFSVYMVETRNVEAFMKVGVTYNVGYIHTLESIGNVHTRDITWIRVLQGRYNKNERILKKSEYPALEDKAVAQKYWDGEASVEPAWEIVATEAKVVAVDDSPTTIRPGLAQWDRILAGK